MCACAHTHKGLETAGNLKHNTQKKGKELSHIYSKTILKQHKFLREPLSLDLKQ